MTKRVSGHGVPRYFVREESTGDGNPYKIVFRDTNEVGDQESTPERAAKRATFYIRRKQNAPKVPVARLESMDSTHCVYIVGKHRVTVTARRSMFVDCGYECTCSGSAGQLGCKHIDAAKAEIAKNNP